MSIFSEVGRILLEEASEPEASPTSQKKSSHTSNNHPKAVSIITSPPVFEAEEIYLDGEDMLRVVSISQVKNYTPPKPILPEEEEEDEESSITTPQEDPIKVSYSVPDSEVELEQELMRVFNETEESSSPLDVEEISPITPLTEETPNQETPTTLEETTPLLTKSESTINRNPSSVEGDIFFPKGGKFTGTLHGNLTAKESFLLCGEVFGSVEADTLILQGVIHGSLQCHNLILRNQDISSLSKVEGTIHTESLSTEFI